MTQAEKAQRLAENEELNKIGSIYRPIETTKDEEIERAEREIQRLRETDMSVYDRPSAQEEALRQNLEEIKAGSDAQVKPGWFNYDDTVKHIEQKIADEKRSRQSQKKAIGQAISWNEERLAALRGDVPLEAIKEQKQSEVRQRRTQQRSDPSNAIGYNVITGRVEPGRGDMRGVVVSTSDTEQRAASYKAGYVGNVTGDPRVSDFFKPVDTGILTPGFKATPPANTIAIFKAETFGVTPQQQRKQIERDQPDSKFNNVNLITGKPEQKETTSYQVNLLESGQQYDLTIGKSTLKNLTGADVAAIQENWKTYNKMEQKKLRDANIKSIAEMREFVRSAKSQGYKTISIQTDKGAMDIPINKDTTRILVKGEYKGAKITGAGLAPNIPGGYALAGSLSSPVWLPEQRIIQQDKAGIVKEYSQVNPFAGPPAGKPDFLEETVKRWTNLKTDNPIIEKAVKPFYQELSAGMAGLVELERAGARLVKPTEPIQSMSFPQLTATSEYITGVTAGAKQAIEKNNFKYFVGGTGKAFEEAKKLAEKQGLIATGFGLAGALFPFGAGGAKSAASKITSVFKSTPKLIKPMPNMGNLPIAMRKPKGEPLRDLNELYKPTPKLAKTPRQLQLEEYEQSEIARKTMQQRSNELAKAGADYTKLRYDITKGKIDLEQITMNLGRGKITPMRGTPEPRYTRSGEAPASSELEDLQKRNIEANLETKRLGEQRTGILDQDTLEKLAPKKERFELVTDKELKELQKRNIEANLARREPKQKLSVTSGLLDRLGFTKKTMLDIGKGIPNILRLKDGSIFKVAEGKQKTFIEKLEQLRKNPELEEREPFKFYVKKQLGEEAVTEPIDLSGRIDFGFQSLKYELGEGFGRSVPRFRFTKASELEDLQKRNIEANLETKRLGEQRTGILDQDTLEKLAPKKERFELVTDKELKELQKRNIEANLARREPKSALLERTSKPAVAKVIRLPSRKELTRFKATRVDLGTGKELFKATRVDLGTGKELFKATRVDLGTGKELFKATRVDLGTGKGTIIKTGVAGGFGLVPAPFIGKVAADNVPPSINMTGINQTEPPILDVTPPILDVTPTMETNTVTAVLGGVTLDTSIKRGVIPKRGVAQFTATSTKPALENKRRSALENKRRSALLPIFKTTPQQKQARITALIRPSPSAPRPRLVQGNPFPRPPRLTPTLRTPPRRPPRPPIIPFFFPSKKEKKKRQEEDLIDKIEFLGGTHVSEITGFRTKTTDITYGKKVVGLAARDVRLSSKGTFTKRTNYNFGKKPTLRL